MQASSNNAKSIRIKREGSAESFGAMGEINYRIERSLRIQGDGFGGKESLDEQSGCDADLE